MRLLLLGAVLTAGYPIFESRVLESREQTEIVDTFLSQFDLDDGATQKSSSTLDLGGAAGDPIGVLYAPSVTIKLPIYPNLSEDALSRGVGVMPSFEDLSGKLGEHAVLSSHNGLSTSGLFSNLDQMKIGDHFFIHNGEEIVEYEVDALETVLPTDASKLTRQDSENRATLITCVPFGVNSHRLLVMGKKIGTLSKDVEIKSEKVTLSQYEKYVLIGSLIVLDIWLILYWLKKRKERVKS